MLTLHHEMKFTSQVDKVLGRTLNELCRPFTMNMRG